MKKISELEKSNHLNEDTLRGSFYLDEDLNEMARIGKIPNTKYEIHMEPGEGYIPHMHICIKTGKNIILRVCLLDNKYFREKDDQMHTLNSKERKALNKYLQETYNAEFGINRWQNLCMIWNDQNPGHKIENIKGLEQPDYTEIKEDK